MFNYSKLKETLNSTIRERAKLAVNSKKAKLIVNSEKEPNFLSIQKKSQITCQFRDETNFLKTHVLSWKSPHRPPLEG